MLAYPPYGMADYLGMRMNDKDKKHIDNTWRERLLYFGKELLGVEIGKPDVQLIPTPTPDNSK
jgi:hypothetical protein